MGLDEARGYKTDSWQRRSIPALALLRKTRRQILQETIEEEMETDNKELSRTVSCSKMRHAGDDFAMQDSPDCGHMSRQVDVFVSFLRFESLLDSSGGITVPRLMVLP